MSISLQGSAFQYCYSFCLKQDSSEAQVPGLLQAGLQICETSVMALVAGGCCQTASVLLFLPAGCPAQGGGAAAACQRCLKHPEAMIASPTRRAQDCKSWITHCCCPPPPGGPVLKVQTACIPTRPWPPPSALRPWGRGRAGWAAATLRYGC